MKKKTITSLAIVMLFFAFSAAFAARPAIPKKLFSIGSGPSGSLFINYTAAWADIMMKNYPGLNIVVEPGGSSQNVQGISTNRMDFGITSSLQNYPGYYGLGWADGTKYTNICSLFPAYSYEAIFITKAGSSIKSLGDINGKKVSAGYAAGGSDVTFRELVDYFDLKPSDVVNASWTDVGGMLQDGLIEAVFYLAGHPASFVQELEFTGDLAFFSLSDAEFGKLLSEKPYYQIGTLKAGTYKGLKSDIKVLQGWNQISVSPALPDDFVYELVRLTWEHVSELQAAHNSFIGTDINNLYGLNVPLHPGAEKYYKEVGAKLPVMPAPPK
jgi:TRAP transporter TAXI family solute receptor